MSEEYAEFEEAPITERDMKECLQRLAPEVQDMIISVHGNLENYIACIKKPKYMCDIVDEISGLYWKKQKVILLRFGLIDGRVRTLDEVASIMGVKRECISVIQGRFLIRMGFGCRRRRKLTDYLE